MRTKLTLLVTTISMMMMGCTKEQIQLPKKQRIALFVEPMTCQQKRDAEIKKQTDSIETMFKWKMSMEYYDYIVYRDSMRLVYDDMYRKHLIGENEWNHLHSELDKSWKTVQMEMENEMNQQMQQVIQRLMSEYNCPQVWKTYGGS